VLVGSPALALCCSLGLVLLSRLLDVGVQTVVGLDRRRVPPDGVSKTCGVLEESDPLESQEVHEGDQSPQERSGYERESVGRDRMLTGLI
jgi:hypothetical protein